ncbi:S26 family signal peptidase [Candidatus Daviesbacteria bacterium]|nr:S26 family signal peptidase [Candidatus Daviesbacteria bacterium]
MKPPVSKFKVYGNSMLPTLHEGQEVLTFNWGKVKVGDIVVVQRGIIKRIVKVEGEHVFVEGDNRVESTDSRHFGPINKSQIVGKVIYYPHAKYCL